MSNLESFNNIYANLSESAYKGRPNPFPNYQNNKTEREFDFSKDKKIDGELTKGGTNLPNDGKVYLQPDNELRTVEEKKLFRTTSYEKGLLTDEKAGFNAYYVTDTPTLTNDTKQTYFVTRGSDGASLDTLNDWLGNNYQFAINKAYIPQAKLATEAMY